MLTLIFATAALFTSVSEYIDAAAGVSIMTADANAPKARLPDGRWSLAAPDVDGAAVSVELESARAPNCERSVAFASEDGGTTRLAGGFFRETGELAITGIRVAGVIYIAMLVPTAGDDYAGQILRVADHKRFPATMTPSSANPSGQFQVTAPRFVLGGAAVVEDDHGTALHMYRDPAVGAVTGTWFRYAGVEASCYTVPAGGGRTSTIFAAGDRPTPLIPYKGIDAQGVEQTRVHTALTTDDNPRLHVVRSKGAISAAYIQESPAFSLSVDAVWP